MSNTVLVVDDEKINQLIVKRVLEEYYTILTASSGREAIEVLETNSVDLVLMDLEMPDMNGIEATKYIKSKEKWKKLPIIFFTSYEGEDIEAECLESGAVDFVSKPITPITLKLRVDRSIELKNFQDELERELEEKSEQALRDQLTGLYNRVYLEREFLKFTMKYMTGALFMLDLDNFKSVNDTYGHIAGDKLLREFADQLLSIIGDAGMICRLGGDEFMILLPELCTEEAVMPYIEQILNGLKEFNESVDAICQVRTSVGVAFYPEGGDDFASLYRNADKALYHVKNNGKGACHIFNEANAGAWIEDVSTDLDNICGIIEEKIDKRKGALNAVGDDFDKLYNFVSRHVTRNSEEVQTVLMTVIPDKREYADISYMEAAMEQLGESIRTSLRGTDVYTKYSSNQFMILLLNTDVENGNIVVQRILSNYTSSKKDNGVSVDYKLRTLKS